ncbi:hypothetical protein N752_31095 [Desulforamulus aquiferis]|nr:hypothetical protein N752_31095 [Desulforamulus aquiferis]
MEKGYSNRQCYRAWEKAVPPERSRGEVVVQQNIPVRVVTIVLMYVPPMLLRYTKGYQ